MPFYHYIQVINPGEYNDQNIDFNEIVHFLVINVETERLGSLYIYVWLFLGYMYVASYWYCRGYAQT